MPKHDRTPLFTTNTKCTCNYCGICGRVPKDDRDEPNRAPLRWWDGDDGWKIGSLCRWCWDEVCNDMPKPDDFAVATASPEKRDQIMAGVPDLDDVETDEDPAAAIEQDDLDFADDLETRLELGLQVGDAQDRKARQPNTESGGRYGADDDRAGEFWGEE